MYNLLSVMNCLKVIMEFRLIVNVAAIVKVNVKTGNIDLGQYSRKVLDRL